MNNDTCSIEGCERARYGRGWCNMHYQRWRKRGSLADPVRVTRLCEFPGCTRKHAARGYCNSHRSQQLRGELVRPLVGKAIPIEERVWSRVTKTGTCWLWTGGTTTHGYGVLWDGARLEGAHRYFYRTLVGPIAPGHDIDHKCFAPNCVNPEHLRPVTRKQNMEHRSGPRAGTSTGVRGVWWWEERRKYVAQVRHHGQHINVGHFKTIEEADAAVRAKRAELFTHDDAVY